MENASKALIMAGGMLLAILVVTVLVFAWGKFSEYQTSKEGLQAIEDTTKFNLQFTNYDRDDVQGYEILSLINQVIDYNERRTKDTINENSEHFEPIAMTIEMGGDISNLLYGEEAVLFTESRYTSNELTAINQNTRIDFKKQIEEKVQLAINQVAGGNEESAKSIAKKIKSIFLTESEIEDKARREGKTEDIIKNEMLAQYNSCVGSAQINDVSELILDERRVASNEYYVAACTYYEYMQFKRGIFTCQQIAYDQTSGRVREIVFGFTGKVH